MAMFMRPQSEIQSNRFGGVVAAPVVGNVIRRIIKEEEGFAKDIEKINVNNETAGVHKSSLEAVNYEDVMPDLEGMSPQEFYLSLKKQI